MLSQSQNLVLQSYFTVSFLGELISNDFLASDYFNNMKFRAPWLKDQLRVIGIDNQGSALMALYAMLVIPRETIFDELSEEYGKVNRFLAEKTINTQSTYAYKSDIPDYLRHIRNAVSHASIQFLPNNLVIFNDKDKKGNTFHTELPLIHFGDLINQLQLIHLVYISRHHASEGASNAV